MQPVSGLRRAKRHGLLFEALEPRVLLDGAPHFDHIIYNPAAGMASVSDLASGGIATSVIPLDYSSLPSSAITPAQIRTAYGVASISLSSAVGTGAGQTIALVDAYDDPMFVSSTDPATDPNFKSSDLGVFDAQFGLPAPPSFLKVDLSGGTTDPAGVGNSNWEGEEALDVEWAHAIAPAAGIVVVQARSQSNADLLNAISTAENEPAVSVVSMSFGWPETSSDPSSNSIFTTPTGKKGVTFVAATGDNGAPGDFPAFSPNVVAVGGTTLTLNGSNYGSEVAWSSGGGGQSQYQSEPSFQEAVQTSGYRQTPDVAWDADPNTGVAVYDSYNGPSTGGSWFIYGGTSVGAPSWAGLIAIADQLRASQNLSPLDGPTTLKTLYSLPVADFHDITGGDNGFPATASYDEATGLGTPVANKLVPDLALGNVPPPTVVSTLPSLAGGTLAAGSNTLTINFSEPVIGGGTISNYQLSSVGPDGLLGTADDVTIPMTVSWSGSTATLSFAPLAESVYRLTIHDTLDNASGVSLDGNGDGSAGSNWVTDFVVDSNGALLGPATTYSTATGSNPLSVAVGDFNGNGKPDLAVANSGTNTVMVLMNNGDGTFTAGSSYSSGYDTRRSSAVPYGIVAGDFNGDGKLDLATANYDQTLDRGTIQIFLGNGNGTFTAGATYELSNTSPISIVAGDFNGDGKLDLAVANYNNGTVTVLMGKGDGTFPTYTSYDSGGSSPRALAVADFNGDGKLDLAVANYDNGTVGILLNSGNGVFPTTATTYSTGGVNPRSLAVGDFNGDGKPDLAVANYASGTVGVLLNNGNGTFPATATTYSTGGSDPRGIVVGDFNNDGKADLAVTNNGSDNVGVLLGNGSGGFSPATTFSTGSGSAPFGLAVGDFNGDGAPDLAVTDSATDSVGILLNTYGPAPVTLTSPHGFTFEIATVASGAGEFVSGSNNAFTGYGRLVVGGTIYQPSAVSYSTADSGQSVITASGTAASMTVSREITVPNTGNDDFARTIDTFSNPTGAPITTTVQVVSTFGSSAAATVFATSDGSGVVAPGDQWIGTVDGNAAGTPAIINYIHGPFGLQPSSVSVVGDNIQWTYNLTVPAGQTTQLAYLTILATTQAAAVASANALVTSSGFGGQTAAFLSQSEVQSLANFVFRDTETWIGSSNGNWTDSQWSNAPPAYPNHLVDAVVNTPEVVTVDSAQQALSLTVNGGGQVTVAAGGSLVVGNSVDLGPNGKLNVLTGGTLALSSLTEGASPASLELNGGVLQATGAFTTTVPLTIDAGGATVDTNGFAVKLSGAVGGGTGNGGLTKIGAGTLTLSAANSYPGGTVVSAGTLVVTNSAALPTGGALTIGAGAASAFAGASSSAPVVSAANRAVSAGVPMGDAVIAKVTSLPAAQAPIASVTAAPAIRETTATDIEAALPGASVRSAPNTRLDPSAASAVLAADYGPANQVEPVRNRRAGPSRPELHATALQSSSAEDFQGIARFWALIDFLDQQRHTAQPDSTSPPMNDLLVG